MVAKILAVLMFIAAVLCAVASIRAFMEKGYLFNNKYIYASKQQREQMTDEEKKPYYRQTAITFLLLSAMWLFNGLYVLTKSGAFLAVTTVVAFVMFFYVIASYIKMCDKK